MNTCGFVCIHTQETRSTQFEKQYWCANWTKAKMSSKSFSAFIVLSKYQFAFKLLRMVQLVYQIGGLTLINIPYWGTTFRASHHHIFSWELCDVWLTSSIYTNLFSKLRYQRISMWIPDWCHEVRCSKLGTYIYTRFGKTITGALFQQKYRSILWVLTPSAFIHKR